MVRDGLVTECPFCPSQNLTRQLIRDKNGVPAENTGARWVINYYPYSDGHTLVVPKRHVTSIHDLTEEEILSYHHMVRFAADTLQKLNPDAGIEVFLQFGKGSRMSLPHLHTHVVLALPTDRFRGLQKRGFFEAFEKNEKKIVMLPVKVTLVRARLLEALKQHVDIDRLAKYASSY